MARTNTRRSTSRPPRRARARSIVRRVLRPEIVGTVLIVLAAALLFYLLPQLPLTRIVNDARDELVGAFGLHIFTLVVLTLAIGLLLALRQGKRLRGHARHLAGAALLLVFSAGMLGFWAPDVIVGEVDLGEASAGGSVGGALTGGGTRDDRLGRDIRGRLHAALAAHGAGAAARGAAGPRPRPLLALAQRRPARRPICRRVCPQLSDAPTRPRGGE